VQTDLTLLEISLMLLVSILLVWSEPVLPMSSLCNGFCLYKATGMGFKVRETAKSILLDLLFSKSELFPKINKRKLITWENFLLCHGDCRVIVKSQIYTLAV